METINKREAWNKGKLVGQKPPLKPKDIWAIRIFLQNAHAVRDLAMFNLAIDSKLRGCDLVSLRVRDIIYRRVCLAAICRVQPFRGDDLISNCQRKPCHWRFVPKPYGQDSSCRQDRSGCQ